MEMNSVSISTFMNTMKILPPFELPRQSGKQRGDMIKIDFQLLLILNAFDSVPPSVSMKGGGSLSKLMVKIE